MEIVTLTWSYSPGDFFEKPIKIKHEDYEVSVEGGRIQARIRPDAYDHEVVTAKVILEEIKLRFSSHQLFSRRAYKLSGPSETRSHVDGRQGARFFAEGVMLMSDVGSPDTLMKDTNGTIVIDSRRERSEREERFVRKVENSRGKHNLVNHMLQSYSAAIEDTPNELVHLYEIQDALMKSLGKKRAVAVLGIRREDWGRFNETCNTKPFRQGRHRGRNLGSLRDATQAELEEARAFARRLIEGYLEYISDSSA